MPLNGLTFFVPGLSWRTTLMLLHARFSSSADLRTFKANETLAMSCSPSLGDASSYIQTVAPWPGNNFMCAPMICCASAALKSEHGSIAGTGCEFTATFGGDDNADGAAPPTFAAFSRLLYPQNSVNQNIAMTIFIRNRTRPRIHPPFWPGTGL